MIYLQHEIHLIKRALKCFGYNKCQRQYISQNNPNSIYNPRTAGVHFNYTSYSSSEINTNKNQLIQNIHIYVIL